MAKAKPLEERARELLKWKITSKVKAPDPFADFGQISEEIEFLANKGYVVARGETPKSLRYEVTPEGKKYALGESTN